MKNFSAKFKKDSAAFSLATNKQTDGLKSHREFVFG